MKSFSGLFVLWCICTLNLFSQPTLQWQKCFGGTSDDAANCIRQCSDSGFVIVGSTQSSDGNVTGFRGGMYDMWIVKTDANGTLEWEKTLGGTNNEIAYSVEQTSDGGFFLTGYTTSNDSDVSGNHGSADVWVVKLDSSGIIQWQKCLGGTGGDIGYSGQLCDDGGYIITSASMSTDGQVTGNNGLEDFWVVKLDSAGNIQWENSYGGSWDEYPFSIQQCADGGYVVAGMTQSNDGDVSGLHGTTFQYDYWVIKLDSGGLLQWQKCLGGYGGDVAYSVIQSVDSGYVVAGQCSSPNDGDVTGNHGASDYWIVKLDSSGSMMWQSTLGGTGSEYAYAIRQCIDGSYVVTGYSNSTDGDVTGNHGVADFWTVNIDSTGSLIWQLSLGGTTDEQARSIWQCYDGSFVLAGQTYSNDGNVSGNNGVYDFWAVKLSDFPTGVPVSHLLVPDVFPNPFVYQTLIVMPAEMIDATLEVVDQCGRIVKTISKLNGTEIVISRDDLEAGSYFYRVIVANEIAAQGKFVITD